MKNVLITGGTKGIGKATCELFSSKGYRTIILYKSDDESAKKLSCETGCICYKQDITDFCATEKTITEITNRYGAIDILINNAGISQQKLFIDISPSDWQRMLSTNLESIYNVTNTVLKSMIYKKSGVIINVSSIWGEHGASCEVHYSASKSAIIGFTKALAKEMGLSGIRVNCISPGMIDTHMNDIFSQDEKTQIINQIPLGRMGTATDCANLIYFLASDDAKYITGQNISINGGWEM